ncbi:hypothetical protein [Methylotuvimicrobium buryatense]|uniref:Relaxase n=1 Tax=Methylotuvimicrobium buryatense TaxID=95641 RepID=A0A4P9ULL5_METBY|nr:hypothetical protein [Methylotuvimicrobium buryatense]QCW81031.1 hypothetical protein EQU24_01250 [Methylotuvimicrobium buryatense]
MIIRISEHESGIEKYLNEGNKSGRSLHRDELDRRMPIYGDLGVFSAAHRYVKKHKKWKKSYWHITVSPAFAQHDLTRARWQEITLQLLEHFFHLYDRNRLAAYAEIHYPIMQSVTDPVTQTPKQRIPHIHLIISKLDLLSDNQLRILPYKKSVAAAFQKWLGSQYSTNYNLQKEADSALKSVQQYREWHRENNRVDLNRTPYSPQKITPVLADQHGWISNTNLSENSRKHPHYPGFSAEQQRLDALDGFSWWVSDAQCWFAEKPEINRLNADISMAALLEKAERDYGLLTEHYRIDDRKLVDNRTGDRVNAIDFAYLWLNLPMDQAISWVRSAEAPIEEESNDPAARF